MYYINTIKNGDSRKEYKPMTKKQFELKLADTINKYGYWSNEVLQLNTKIYLKYGSDFMHALNNKLRQETEN